MELSSATCPYCAENIKPEALKCRYCCEYLTDDARAAVAGRVPIRLSAYNPGLSAVLSTVVPGLGHIFQGRILMGLAIILLLVGLNLIGFAMFLNAHDRNVSIVVWMLAIAAYVANIYNAYYYQPPALSES